MTVPNHHPFLGAASSRIPRLLFLGPDVEPENLFRELVYSLRGILVLALSVEWTGGLKD
jgi:hypothetical protein